MILKLFAFYQPLPESRKIFLEFTDHCLSFKRIQEGNYYFYLTNPIRIH